MVGTHMRLHRTNRSGLLTERSHQNAGGGPINNLPFELLAQIFMWLREGYHPWDDYSWCSILLVNWLWHEVAIQTTSLWTTLNLALNTPDCFFERTYMLPLTLHWAVNDSEHRALHRFSSHFFRCSSLCLKSMPDDNGQRAFDGLTSLPLLEILMLFPTSNLHPLAELFISGDFPRLHTLWFSPRDFQMTYTVFASTLRSLHIDASSSRSKPTIAELVHGLQQMPLLELLTLKSVVSHTEDAVIHTSVATLDRLRMLCITGPLWTSSLILNVLSIPPTVSIEICSHLKGDEGLDEPGIVSSLTELAQAICDITHPAGGVVSPLKYMQAHYDCEDQDDGPDTVIVARLYCTRHAFSLDDAHQTKGLQYYERVSRQTFSPNLQQEDFGGVQISIYWSYFEPHPEWDWTLPPQAWLQPLLHTLPLKEISTVALSLDEKMIYMDVADICPNVSTLLAWDGDDTYQGLSYLLDQTPDGRRLSAYPHFPMLKTLVLDHHYVISAYELVRLRCSLRGLRISHTLTLEKIRIVGAISQDALIALKDLKDAFPEIDIAMLNTDYSEIDVEAM